MNITDKKTFAELMAGAGEVYDKAITTSLLKIYFDMLGNYEIDQIQQAFRDHMLDSKAGKFFPKPADIVSAVERRNPKPNVDHQAELAWAEVISRLEGKTRSLTGGSVQLAAIESVGGIASLGRTDYAELKWVKRDFLKIYAALSEAQSENMPKGLPGRSDITGARLCSSGPVRISAVKGVVDETAA